MKDDNKDIKVPYYVVCLRLIICLFIATFFIRTFELGSLYGDSWKSDAVRYVIVFLCYFVSTFLVNFIMPEYRKKIF